MRYFIQILTTSILILFLITACSPKQSEQAPINKEKMKAILMDMHFAQAAAQFNMVSKDSLLRAHKSAYYPEILSNHQTNETEYQVSYAYYLNHPEILLEMYDEIMEDLSKMTPKKEQ